MATELDMTKARKIAPTYDNRGNPSWTTRMSPPDDTFAQCLMVPDRIVPVIFVPGVMGSNLIQKDVDPDKAIAWRMDDTATALAWASPARGAKFRKQYLQPQAMDVDKGGIIPDGTQQQPEELRRRCWGEVGAMSYAPFLVWLENALNDFDDPHTGQRVTLMKEGLQALKGEGLLSHDEVGLSYRYCMPVHVCGYNWLGSNAVSALRLGRRIDEVIQRYRQEGKKCEKVILVTHSMGGLVARHCSEVLRDQNMSPYRDKILGVVHGVMPAIGAAAVYRRFKAGTENPKTGFMDSLIGAVGASALGNDAAEMTAVLSSAPGPMQLLPTPEYGNGWLKIRDGAQEYSLPRNGDPYGEIYAVGDKWWSMCETQLINPLNDERHPEKRALQVKKDWGAFTKLIEHVEEFHTAIKSLYHPNTHAFFGSHPDQKAYGNVTWQRIGAVRAATDPMDAMPQNPDQISTTRTVKAPVVGQPKVSLVRHFMIQEPEENGDGTVPHRSGIAAQGDCKSFLQVNVGHEPAYKHGDGADNLRACRFTLRAIVKIAQDVVHTSLKYD